MRRVVLAATMLWVAGCGDGGTEPDDPVVALIAADTVVVEVLRDSVWMGAELLHESGRVEAAEAAVWDGCEDGVGTVSAAGAFVAMAAGECTATASWGGMQASSRVVVRPRGVLTLTFDDGWMSARTIGLPVLSAAGLVANVAVVPETEPWPGFIGEAEMHELHDAGWSFVSHTMTHDSLPSLPDDSLVWQIEEPVHWLRQRGLRTGNVFIVPYHEWGDREKAAIRARFAAARGTAVDRYWPEYMAAWRPEDPYGLTSIDGSTLARTAEGRERAMAYVSQAVAEGRFLDIQFHDIRPEDEAGSRALVDELSAFRNRVRTWSELFPLPDDDS